MTIRTFFLLLTVIVVIASCTSKIQQLENRRAALQKEIDDLNRSAAGKLFQNAHEACMKESKTAEECNVEDMKLRQSVIQTIHDDRQEILSIENQLRVIRSEENGNK